LDNSQVPSLVISIGKPGRVCPKISIPSVTKFNEFEQVYSGN
jgi:hypothetical protein